jgi:hypothetical protein
VPYQRWVIIGIWLLFLGDAIRQGLSLRGFGAPDRPFQWIVPAFGVLVPPLFAVLNYFYPINVYRPGFVGRWFDRRYGPGSAFAFLRGLRPVTLFACTSFVLGAVGLWSSLHDNPAVPALEMSSFFLAAGIGFGIASLLVRRWFPNEPWI